MRATALALALLACPVTAQDRPQPVLASGETMEVALRADLDGDGLQDLAYIASRADSRELRVVASRRASDVGDNAWQVLALDPYPLGNAELQVEGNVLLLDELAGGTTAIASTHRFRWDPELRAMRLIGLDATLYSRTLAHDGQETSWNLLTGDVVTRTLKLDRDSKDAAYARVGEIRSRKPSPPVRLEDAPGGDELLGWPGAE